MGSKSSCLGDIGSRELDSRLANLDMGDAILNETLRDAAQTKGRERCECFFEALSGRLEKDQALAKEVSTEFDPFASGK